MYWIESSVTYHIVLVCGDNSPLLGAPFWAHHVGVRQSLWLRKFCAAGCEAAKGSHSQNGGNAGWIIFLLLVAAAAAVTAWVLYRRMEFYRDRETGESPADPDMINSLQARIEHLSNSYIDWRTLCYRLSRHSAQSQIVLARELEQLEVERNPVADEESNTG